MIVALYTSSTTPTEWIPGPQLMERGGEGAVPCSEFNRGLARPQM